MRATACTLFEGDYHYGVGALVNSLYLHGYRGTFWIGWRGGDLPSWARAASPGVHGLEFSPAPGLTLCFCRENPGYHLSHHKPEMMRRVLQEYDPETGAVFYFDPDIVINRSWDFFENWIRFGIPLCEALTSIGISHPLRYQWKSHARSWGYTSSRDFDFYLNSGFIGIKREDVGFLKLWEKLIFLVQEQHPDRDHLTYGDRTNPFQMADQDALNVALMISDQAISAAGPDGMSFSIGNPLMSHAIGMPKPWDIRYIPHCLQGKAPTRAQRNYWLHVSAPIRLYPRWKILLKEADLFLARLIARIFRHRPPNNL